MKKILYFAAALFCAGSSVFAQNPRRVPPRQAPVNNNHIVVPVRINATGTGTRQEMADNEALGCFESKAFNMVMDNFPIITTFTSYGETDRKGEIKNATIAAGVDMGVVKTDIFHVFYSADPYGKKIGKVKVTHPAINGSECNITGGQKDITAAVNSGANLFLLSKGQVLF